MWHTVCQPCCYASHTRVNLSKVVFPAVGNMSSLVKWLQSSNSSSPACILVLLCDGRAIYQFRVVINLDGLRHLDLRQIVAMSVFNVVLLLFPNFT